MDSIAVSEKSYKVSFNNLEIIIQDNDTTENILRTEDEFDITQVVDRKVVYVDSGTVVSE